MRRPGASPPTWADDHPLAAQELCTAMHPGFMPALDPTWHGHVPMPGDPAIANLLLWAARHPDAAQDLEPNALQ